MLNEDINTSPYISEYITSKEFDKIIKAYQNREVRKFKNGHTKGNVKNRERDILILRTLYETGGRVSEVLSLRKGYISDDCIFMPTLKRKTKTGIPPLHRVYLLAGSILLGDLHEWCSNKKLKDDDWVFQGNRWKDISKAGQVSSAYIWYLLSAIGGKITPEDSYRYRKDGLAVEANVRKLKNGESVPAWCHLLRHGAAMEMYNRTEDMKFVQKELGHSSMRSTSVYADMTPDKQKEIADRAVKREELK